MTAIVMNQQANQQAMPKTAIMELMAKRFHHLPDNDKTILNYGSLYLGANGAFAGVLANIFCRKALSVTKWRFTSSLPMAAVPFMTTVALYHETVVTPLLSGELDCPTCAVTRGALVGACAAGLYPVMLALPVNISLAVRYQTVSLPEKGNVKPFLMNLTRPILNKMGAVFVLQTLFGTYLSSRHFDIYLKLLQIKDEEFQQ